MINKEATMICFNDSLENMGTVKENIIYIEEKNTLNADDFPEYISNDDLGNKSKESINIEFIYAISKLINSVIEPNKSNIAVEILEFANSSSKRRQTRYIIGTEKIPGNTF